MSRLCCKIPYPSLVAARAGHTGMSYYRCPHCDHWHVTTPGWQRTLLRALSRALNTLPLTHGAAGDPPTGRHTVVHRMKQAGATPL
jgi:hypothetical protein